jgi:cytochrome c biogenesis protein CcdA
MKVFRYLFVALSFFILASPALAEDKVLVEVLGRQDCAHCDDEKAYLSGLSKERGDFEVRSYDIAEPASKDLFDRVTEREGLSKATPITLVGGTIIQGFDSEETTGKRIEALITENVGGKNYGFEGLLAAGGSRSVEKTIGGTCDDGGVCRTPGGEPLLVTIPFAGTVDVARYSLPVLSAVLGFVDGFNPCAMWVLVTFLLVLVQLGNRRQVWMVAGLFILAEAVMYYLILNVWFTAWDFVGLDRIVTPVVGVIAVGGGLFFLYEWLYADGTCLVTDVKKRARISGQIKKLATEPFTWLTAVGVVALALSVNVIEFACSIGIPQAFTKIVELNSSGFLETQGYMLTYILFYMVDDLIVFGLALWGAGKLAETAGYARWCNLGGGLLMVLLGALLIFAPDWLRF